MLPAKKQKAGKSVTLVELFSLLCILAILATSVIPIYRAIVASRKESQVIQGMSVVKNAQDIYYSEYGRYAGAEEFQIAIKNTGLDCSPEDLSEMKHVNCENLYVAVKPPKYDACVILWIGPDFDKPGPSAMAMDQNGHVYKQGADLSKDWMPEFPQQKE